jgi:hypothetical protein
MVEDIRKSYELDELTEEKAGDDPFLLLRRWLDEALQADIIEPNAMCLATVDEQGNPDARFVLLRGLDDAGLVFYTNGEQREGQAARASPLCDAGVLVGRAGASNPPARAHRASERRGGGRLLRASPRAGISSRRGSRPRASRFPAVRGWSSAPPKWNASSKTRSAAPALLDRL